MTVPTPVASQEPFARLAVRLSEASTPKEAALAILDIADEVLGWDAAYLLLYSPERDVYHHIVDIDTVEGERRQFSPSSSQLRPTSMAAKTMKEGAQMLLLEAEEDWRKADLQPFGLPERPSMSMLYVPIRRRDQHIGVLSIQSYTRNAYRSADLQTLQVLADYCAGALDRCLTELKVRQQERLIRAFAELGKTLAAAKTPRDAAEIILRSADDLFSWDACFLSIYQEESDRFHPLIIQDTDENGQRLEVPPPQEDEKPSPMARRVLHEGAQLLFRRAPNDLEVSAGLSWFGLRQRPSNTLMFAPIRFGDRTVGLMSVQSYRFDAYNDADLQALQALGDHCGGALARVLAESSLFQQQELFRLVSQQIPSLLWAVDQRLQFTLIPAGNEQHLGGEFDAAVGKSLLDVLPKDESSEQMIARHWRALRGQSGSCELTLGGRTFDCRIEPLQDSEGRLMGVLNIGHDITERKQAEAKLLATREDLEHRVAERTHELSRSNEELKTQIAERIRAEREQEHSLSLLRATLQSTADGLIVTDLGGRLRVTNDNARRMLNLPHNIADYQQDAPLLEDLVVAQISRAEKFARWMSDLNADPETQGAETLHLRDGRVLEIFSKPQHLSGEVVGRVWSFRDVTQRRRAEEALLRSEAIYREAIEAASGVPYITHYDNDYYEFMGEGLSALLGISPRRLKRRRLVELVRSYEFIDDNHTGTLQEYLDQFATGKIPQYRVDLRMITAAGEEKWINDTSVPLRDAGTGRVYGSLGILQDITMRKLAEIEARRQNETQRRELEEENQMLKQRLRFRQLESPASFAEIVTANETMHLIFRYVESIAVTDQPVLVVGETGVGKELMARSIHQASGREGAFIPVNVAGLDDEMFSDTLFGHKRGAFTGALQDRRGLVEAASGGTLFLDEIGDLGTSAQVKLLRLLQEREYYQLGSDAPKYSKARIVVATNQNLKALIQSGAFRKDLFYRLQTHKIEIPPLRDRPEDVAVLTDHFMARAAEKLGKAVPTPPRELYTLLASYHFPGNVRELESMIFDALSKHESRVLSLEVFHRRIQGERGMAHPPQEGELAAAAGPRVEFGPCLPTIKEVTERLVDEALRRASNNQSVAARMLGVTQQALNRRVRVRREREAPLEKNPQEK